MVKVRCFCLEGGDRVIVLNIDYLNVHINVVYTRLCVGCIE